MTPPGIVSNGRAPDVVVIGAGLVGLAVAAAAARRGASVLLLADVRRGEASAAAAGVLGPSLDRPGTAAHRFAVAARDLYPEYVARLAGDTGVEVPLNRLGIIQLALDERESTTLRAEAPASAEWLDARALTALEPALGQAAGALFHPHDGAVNNLALIRALKTFVGRHPGVRVLARGAASIEFGATPTVITADGTRHSAAHVVLAAGAWAPQLAGLPTTLPIEPLRGQMMSVASRAIRHVTFGGGGYVVPRADGRVLIGSTSEHVGFDASHDDAGVATVRRIGTSIAPALGAARMLSAWAGLRPMTPDLQPIIGRDPREPALLHACGHSRNGILLAPLTGECVAALIAGEPTPADLSPFSADRFRE